MKKILLILLLTITSIKYYTQPFPPVPCGGPKDNPFYQPCPQIPIFDNLFLLLIIFTGLILITKQAYKKIKTNV